MALLLKEKDVEELLTMPLTLELIERVHREYSTGQAIDVPRERTRLPKAALHILQGAVPSANVLGYKAYTSSKEGVRFHRYAIRREPRNLDAIVEANLLGMTAPAPPGWPRNGSRAPSRRWSGFSARMAGARPARALCRGAKARAREGLLAHRGEGREVLRADVGEALARRGPGRLARTRCAERHRGHDHDVGHARLRW